MPENGKNRKKVAFVLAKFYSVEEDEESGACFVQLIFIFLKIK